MEIIDKILFSIFENIGLGAVVGFSAFILKIVLEKYKTHESMCAEVAKLRINKISEIWESFDHLYIQIVRLFLRTHEIKRMDRDTHEKYDSLSEKCKLLLKDEIEQSVIDIKSLGIAAIEDKIMAHRFWLGKKLTVILGEQKVELERLANLIHEEIYREDIKVEFSDLRRLMSHIDATRKDITDMIKYL